MVATVPDRNGSDDAQSERFREYFSAMILINLIVTVLTPYNRNGYHSA